MSKKWHFLPPHLQDEEALKKQEKNQKWIFKIGPQGPSKYGPGGRRLAKAKWRKKK